MQAVSSDHPPGGVCLITGDLTRYGQAMRSCMWVKVPPGSTAPWMMGTLVGHNINVALQAVMDNPAMQWAWLMGDDHTFAPDILLRLLDRDVDCIVPLCLNRKPPFDPTVAGRGAMKSLRDMPSSGLYELSDGEVCGDAGMLVKRHVLEAIGAPWHDLNKSGSHNAEDREFVSRVKAAGFRVHVDCDNVIGHMAPVEFWPVNKDGKWEVRLVCSQQYVCDLG